MKEKVKGFIVGVIITVMLMGTIGVAEGVKQTIEVIFNQVNLEVNGEKVDADNILYEGTTYVPLRKVAEMLGKEVGWNEETKTASIVNSVEKKSDLTQGEVSTKENDFMPINKAIALKLDNKIYFCADVYEIFENKDGKYYSNMNTIACLLSCFYKDFEVKQSKNQFVDGVLVTNYKKYFAAETKYTSINDSYYEGNFYNKDKTKTYLISTEKNKERGICIYEGRSMISLDEVFNALEINYDIELDEENKLIIFTPQKK